MDKEISAQADGCRVDLPEWVVGLRFEDLPVEVVDRAAAASCSTTSACRCAARRLPERATGAGGGGRALGGTPRGHDGSSGAASARPQAAG